MHCGTSSLLLLRLALAGAVHHHIALLATIIIDIGAYFALPSMEFFARVALDMFGLLVGLTIVALLDALPFLTLPLEIPLLVVVLPI